MLPPFRACLFQSALQARRIFRGALQPLRRATGDFSRLRLRAFPEALSGPAFLTVTSLLQLRVFSAGFAGCPWATSVFFNVVGCPNIARSLEMSSEIEKRRLAII